MEIRKVTYREYVLTPDEVINLLGTLNDAKRELLEWMEDQGENDESLEVINDIDTITMNFAVKDVL